MKYKILYSDPPYSYKVWSKKGEGRTAESHYNTMTKEDLQELDVNSIAADNSVLFLWVTAPCLIQGVELIKSWGFVYKTIGFTWVKRNKIADSWFFGMGYYTRANAELCLLATKGKPLERKSHSVPQIVDERIKRHSEKPDCVRERIVELFGDLPRIELFAREEHEGWATIGNEVDGKDIRNVL